MSCENPMIRVQIKDGTNHKDAWKIYNMRKFCKGGYRNEISLKANGIDQDESKTGRYNTSEQIWLERQLKTGRAIQIPCGKCPACQKSTAGKWSARIELEAKDYIEKYFLTLTYDPENIPVLDIETGEIYRQYRNETKAYLDIRNRKFKYPEKGTLWPDDMTKFIKRLRDDATYNNKAEKADENSLNIKYFYCGEYGGDMLRPHYHMIILGYIIPDAQFWKYETDENGKQTPLDRSETLEKIWGHGIVSIQKVEQGSIGYTTGYCQKKGQYYATTNENGEVKFKKYDEIFREAGLVPEFRRMSKSIGKKWAIEHAETMNEVKGGELANGHHMPTINYFDKVVDEYFISKEQNQPMKEANETTEDETQTLMKSQYMKGVKEKRRQNAVDINENTRYNARHDGSHRLIMEQLDNETDKARRERKYKKRKEKGQF